MRPYPLSAADVSQSVRATLMAHLPAHLADSPRPLPAPTSYEEVPNEEAVRRVHRSTLAVVTPGMRSNPERFGDGSYRLQWGVVVVVWHQQLPGLPLLTAGGDYAAQVRRTLLEHRPSIATHVDWIAESWDFVGDGLSEATLGRSMTEFAVSTGDTLLYSTTPDTSGPVVLTTDVQLDPDTL
ncbi:MAG: hypothetical protein JWO69_2001 [Thermoleophilia bacterium]|nr:hypothetical protein [Thermoleophilia bacterium]